MFLSVKFASSINKGSPYERWVDDEGVKRVGDTANPQFITRTFAAEIFCRDHLPSRVMSYLRKERR
jgi:hypothetical protein